MNVNNTPSLENSFKELDKLYYNESTSDITGIAERSRTLFHDMHRDYYKPLCEYYEKDAIYAKYNNPTFLFPVNLHGSVDPWYHTSTNCVCPESSSC